MRNSEFLENPPSTTIALEQRIISAFLVTRITNLLICTTRCSTFSSKIFAANVDLTGSTVMIGSVGLAKMSSRGVSCLESRCSCLGPRCSCCAEILPTFRPAKQAFVHVPKDERSKLDMKTRQCIFIGYGKDKYGYRLYDPVEKKLVKIHDVQFVEDQTIEDNNKVKKITLEKDNSLFEIDPIRMLIHDLDTVENNVQNGEQHNYVGDQQLGDDFDNLGDALEPPLVQLRRSNRKRQSSTRYTFDEYVTLTNEEELQCYQKAMESEEKQKWLDAIQDEINSLHDNYTYDLVKLPNGKRRSWKIGGFTR
ncbi:hypothetical protein CR513_30933, partial [Mucuna pruriens]